MPGVEGSPEGEIVTTAEAGERKRPVRWHIAVFLAPAVLVYSLIMILPLYGDAAAVAVPQRRPARRSSSASTISARCSAIRAGRPASGTRSATIPGSSSSTCWCRTRSACCWRRCCPARGCAFRAFYRTAIFIPTILSFVIVGFVWKLILSPLWGIAPHLLDTVGLKSLFVPWLGKEEYALTTLGLISVWQFVGIPMMLIYAALLSIPDEVIEAAECDGITGMAQFWKIKLPLILPSIGIISILTFVGNFNAFDLIYSAQGALAGPNFSTDILGTFLYRTFFGFQLQLGDPNMGATIATMMFLIILAGVCVYLFAVQTRLRRYQF